MASHNRTPQSILDAPEKNVVVVEPHPGLNRAMLRKMGARGESLGKPHAHGAKAKRHWSKHEEFPLNEPVDN